MEGEQRESTMGHFRLNILDSRGGGVFGGFGGGVVEVRGTKKFVSDRFFFFFFWKENGRRTGGLLVETLLWSHRALPGQV